MHNASNLRDFDDMAKELNLLISQAPMSSVLELGCGNGIFYERLGFDKCDYTGVDISSAMIRKFKTEYPAAQVHVGNAMDFHVKRKFDLIFSNGLLQYFSTDEFARHLGYVAKMLNPGGRVIHSAIPLKPLRWGYYTGDIYGSKPKRSLRRLAGAILYNLGLKDDTIGHWYSWLEIRKTAARYGFNTRFHGSLYYPYRFHAYLTLKADKA
jgi:SAM-dependent methyltransferase